MCEQSNTYYRSCGHEMPATRRCHRGPCRSVILAPATESPGVCYNCHVNANRGFPAPFQHQPPPRTASAPPSPYAQPPTGPGLPYPPNAARPLQTQLPPRQKPEDDELERVIAASLEDYRKKDPEEEAYLQAIQESLKDEQAKTNDRIAQGLTENDRDIAEAIRLSTLDQAVAAAPTADKDDPDVQAALRLSLEEAQAKRAAMDAATALSKTDFDDDDLQRALQASMQDQDVQNPIEGMALTEEELEAFLKQERSKHWQQERAHDPQVESSLDGERRGLPVPSYLETQPPVNEGPATLGAELTLSEATVKKLNDAREITNKNGQKMWPSLVRYLCGHEDVIISDIAWEPGMNEYMDDPVPQYCWECIHREAKGLPVERPDPEWLATHPFYRPKDDGEAEPSKRNTVDELIENDLEPAVKGKASRPTGSEQPGNANSTGGNHQSGAETPAAESNQAQAVQPDGQPRQGTIGESSASASKQAPAWSFGNNEAHHAESTELQSSSDPMVLDAEPIKPVAGEPSVPGKSESAHHGTE